MNFKPNSPMPLRGDIQIKYNRARANLLLVLIFTAVNLFAATFADRYFLFSATIPMLFPLSAAEIVAELSAQGAPANEQTLTMIVGLVLGLILTIPYLLCWIFSKKRVGWMVGALVFFSIDCLFLLISFDLSMLMDILIHAWVMYYLVTGVINGFKLKNMPEEMPLPDMSVEAPAENSFDTFDQNDFNYTATTASTVNSETTANVVDKGEAHVAKSDDE